MSAHSSFYLEERRPDGSFRLLMDGDSHIELFGWGGGSFRRWVFENQTWEGAGEPPHATEGMPDRPSSGLLRVAQEDDFEDQHVGWLWLRDMQRTNNEEMRAWLETELRRYESALTEVELDAIRVTVATG